MQDSQKQYAWKTHAKLNMEASHKCVSYATNTKMHKAAARQDVALRHEPHVPLQQLESKLQTADTRMQQ